MHEAQGLLGRRVGDGAERGDAQERRRDVGAGVVVDEARVVVWGEDDFGLERTFASPDEAGAFAAALPNPITEAWLRARGFGAA